MTQGFDLVEGVAAGLEDRAAAWWFVQDFAEHWVAPLAEGDGWAEADLAAAEERLGHRLPAALREAYGRFGRREDLTANHDPLLGPAELHLDAGGGVLVLRHGKQGAAWGIPVDELHRPDPSVVLETGGTWRPWLDRLSVALVELVLSESLRAPEDRTDHLEPLDVRTLLGIEEGYVQLPFPDYPVFSAPSGSRWFAGDDVLLREDDGGALYVRARTPEALADLRKNLPGTWLNADGA
ncbi:SMI1/KNR4 family protein [Kitasatospora sp. DSM 101779]|uniref:SMI1/KNR4 family protein n=1 Tax=Kitasatospora sp. DSM 101779 TaxID=2853165 RepID=UPI0021D89458|nr:SMI1/KNR4 family protein [Kitasatospora sp. DSM 101779]MCU7826022.1 SMI1/KNR4 family protein [Kitasatospora sp. DSM 101779]